MSGELVPLVVESDAAMCPNDMPPRSEPHRLHVQMLDAVYEAAERDENGEMTPALDKAYRAAERLKTMRLYRDTAQVRAVVGWALVESWYWRCPICGFVLPAAKMGSPA